MARILLIPRQFPGRRLSPSFQCCEFRKCLGCKAVARPKCCRNSGQLRTRQCPLAWPSHHVMSPRQPANSVAGPSIGSRLVLEGKDISAAVSRGGNAHKQDCLKLWEYVRFNNCFVSPNSAPRNSSTLQQESARLSFVLLATNYPHLQGTNARPPTHPSLRQLKCRHPGTPMHQPARGLQW